MWSWFVLLTFHMQLFRFIRNVIMIGYIFHRAWEEQEDF